MRPDGSLTNGSRSALNGHLNGSLNGTGNAELVPSSSKFTPLYSESSIDRTEMTRLIMQMLGDLGLERSVAALSEESGTATESPRVAEFRRAVLAGQWTAVLNSLRHIHPEFEQHERELEFLIAQEKYLELLDSRQTRKALHVLRNELFSLCKEADHLHHLSSLMMCGDSADLRKRATWKGVDAGSRRLLLNKLQGLFPPTILMPERRLSTLVEQARSYQHYTCPYHMSTSTSETLLSDHVCEPAAFPDHTSQVLTAHADQVWALAFSHSGKYLATAGADGVALVWIVNTDFKPKFVMSGHKAGIFCLAWSPDDRFLLTSADTVVKLWDAQTGSCIATLAEHQYQISAVAWLPDGKSFVSAGMDAKLYFWDTRGNVISTWKTGPYRIGDMTVTSDGKKLIAVGRAEVAMPIDPQSDSSSNIRTAPLTRAERRLQIYDIAQQKQIASVSQSRDMSCVVASADSRYVLVNQPPSDVYLYDVDTAQLVRRYSGHRQTDDILRSCFGGPQQNFVVSGSEDSKIYIWHRYTGALINVLNGHTRGSVNAVAWNPVDPAMFASAGDDHTIRIWQPLKHA